MKNNKGYVDELITSVPGEWKFDEQVSKILTHMLEKVFPCMKKYKKKL